VSSTLPDILISFSSFPPGLHSLRYLIYSIYKCQSQNIGHHIIKFADNSVKVSLLVNNDPEHVFKIFYKVVQVVFS